MQFWDRASIYRQVIEAISRNDGTVLDQFLAQELIDHNPIPGQSPGRAGFKEWMASARASFPDLQGTIEDVILADSDYLIGRVTWQGTQRGPFAGLPPTNRAATLAAIHIVRFEAGRVVAWWGIADLLGTIHQLGGKIVPG
jgi:steroid delta-isomerase-like uncharacterized protein